MEPLPQQDYYELLEVSPAGTPQQIERAYRIARITYEPASAATYSVFDTEETASILRRVEEAYATLSDARLRREYDMRLRHEREAATEPEPKEDPPAVAPTLRAAVPPAQFGAEPAPQLSFEAVEVVEEEAPQEEAGEPLPPMRHPSAEASHPTVEVRGAPPSVEMDLDESLEPSDGIYDGAALRRIRLGLGIELDEISALTKINEPYLRAIEANDYMALPPVVYVRGFVREFAKSIGLDPKLVAESYVGLLQAGIGARA